MTKKDNKKIIILIIVLLISIGYTALNTTLNINGITNIKENTWDIHFENVQVKDGSVQANTPQIDQDRTTVTYSVTLDKPGDYFEFTVDAVNDGTIDGMIESIVKTNLTPSQSKYLNNSITYLSGLPVEENDLLKTGESVVFKVRVEYKKDIRADDLPDDNINGINLSLTVNYVQKDSNAVEKPRKIDFVIHNDSYNPMTGENNTKIVDFIRTKYELSCEEDATSILQCTFTNVIFQNEPYEADSIMTTIKDTTVYEELEAVTECQIDNNLEYAECYGMNLINSLLTSESPTYKNYGMSTEKNVHYDDPDINNKKFNFDNYLCVKKYIDGALRPRCEYGIDPNFFMNFYNINHSDTIDLYPIVREIS